MCDMQYKIFQLHITHRIRLEVEEELIVSKHSSWVYTQE